MSKKLKFSMIVMVVSLVLMLGFSLAVAGPAPKVDVCHNDGSGVYVKINISENAFQAHVEHGDESPNQYVPGMSGWAFDDNCVPYELMTDEVFVNGVTGEYVSSAFNTKPGIQYKLVAGGKYRFANWATAAYPDLGWADAKYSMRKPPYNPNGDFIGWVDGKDLNTDYGLQVVSYAGSYTPPLTPVNWIEEFNEAHVYTAYVSGDGAPIRLFIYDNYYGDNLGGITVHIYEQLP
jgi:hypothetical protein